MAILWPIFILCVIAGIMKYSNRKGQEHSEAVSGQFLAENPDAVKIYSNKNSFIRYFIEGLLLSKAKFYIEEVNGTYPYVFYESSGASDGSYVKPGENTLVVGAYRKSKRGIRNIEGPLEIKVNVEVGKMYKLRRANSTIVCEEIQ